MPWRIQPEDLWIDRHGTGAPCQRPRFAGLPGCRAVTAGVDWFAPRPRGLTGLFGGCHRSGNTAFAHSQADPGSGIETLNKDLLYLESIRDCLERMLLTQ